MIEVLNDIYPGVRVVKYSGEDVPVCEEDGTTVFGDWESDVYRVFILPGPNAKEDDEIILVTPMPVKMSEVTKRGRLTVEIDIALEKNGYRIDRRRANIDEHLRWQEYVRTHDMWRTNEPAGFTYPPELVG